MKKNIRELIQMYDNSLGAEGYHRKECGHTPQSEDELLGHVRWMIDHMANGDDPRFEGPHGNGVAMCWVGMIQGILFAAKKFSLPALRSQGMDLCGPQQEMKPVKTLPALKPV